LAGEGNFGLDPNNLVGHFPSDLGLEVGDPCGCLLLVPVACIAAKPLTCNDYIVMDITFSVDPSGHFDEPFANQKKPVNHAEVTPTRD
jgi:hypothetical protein